MGTTLLDEVVVSSGGLVGLDDTPGGEVVAVLIIILTGELPVMGVLADDVAVVTGDTTADVVAVG